MYKVEGALVDCVFGYYWFINEDADTDCEVYYRMCSNADDDHNLVNEEILARQSPYSK